MKKYICALFLLCVSSTIFAFTPAPGLWWNPNESGRGYAIDVQNNAIVVTVFIYDSAGNPTFYQAAGIYNESLRSFSAQLGEFHGGQCFGCAYSRPTGVAVGTLSIVFSSPENGTLYYPGGSTSIQHELYGYTNKTDYFLGEWSFTLNTSGLLGTQWVVFNGHYTGSDGTIYASGQEDSQQELLRLPPTTRPATTFLSVSPTTLDTVSSISSRLAMIGECSAWARSIALVPRPQILPKCLRVAVCCSKAS